MNKLTALFKALSDQNRLRLLCALAKYNELCACQLTELIQVTGATVSRHMGILIACGLVDSRKEGRWVYYRVGREQTDFGALIDWIETHINNDPHIALDAKTLEKITSCSPEDFCRKKRIKNCTPKQ